MITPSLVDHDRLAKAELLDRAGDGLHRLIVVAGVILVGANLGQCF